jgi:hypothetical protein
VLFRERLSVKMPDAAAPFDKIQNHFAHIIDQEGAVELCPWDSFHCMRQKAYVLQLKKMNQEKF